jgi:ABC-type phosphate transport system substrate-binding protein
MKRTQQLAVVGLVLVALVASAGADGFVLIRNAKSPSAALSKSEVRAIYTGKSKMFGNDAAVVVVPTDDTPAFSGFADQLFGTNTKTLLSKIKQEVFKGEMSKPLKATADDEVVHLVAGTAGAIGVVSAPTAKALPATVAVIAIGG